MLRRSILFIEVSTLEFFVGFKPNVLISDFIKEIKVESNEFINNKKWIRRRFDWQDGFGVFSYSHSYVDRVIKYIMSQESHHRKKTFAEEYHELLERFAIPYGERYLFEFVD